MKVTAGIALQALATSTASAATVARGTASNQLCAGSSFQEGGNWYCRPVSHITYQNVGTSGQYNEVVGMDQQTGACEFQPKKFSGPLAPFNEPMSLHFRGPLRLKQLAVYMPTGKHRRVDTAPDEQTESQNSTVVSHENDYHHSHKQFHPGTHRPRHHHHDNRQPAEKALEEAAKPKVKKRACDPIVWVTATIDGQVVSWINDYCPGAPAATPTPAPNPPSNPAQPVEAPAATTAPASRLPLSPPAPPQHVNSGPGGKARTGSFSRTGYYNAKRQKSQGLTFLGNFGGTGSGKWTPTFGNTLSYINEKGSGGAVRSTVLSDTTIPSSREVIVMTDQRCDKSCGYVQPGSVAYKGFDGADKIFLMEFSMPHDANAGSGPEADMPAVWMLNARIPLTAQYHSCSCWATGCGEFDVFEVLDPGGAKAKSTFHSVFRGGDSNYFDRPVAGAIRLAVVYDLTTATVSVKVLGPAAGDEFKTFLTAEEIQDLDRDDAGLASAVSSSFKIGGL